MDIGILAEQRNNVKLLMFYLVLIIDSLEIMRFRITTWYQSGAPNLAMNFQERVRAQKILRVAERKQCVRYEVCSICDTM